MTFSQFILLYFVIGAGVAVVMRLIRFKGFALSGGSMPLGIWMIIMIGWPIHVFFALLALEF